MPKKPTYKELEKELILLKAFTDSQILLNFSGALFIGLDVNGNVMHANKKACEVLGYKENEIVGKNWFENFIPERIKAIVLEVFKKSNLEKAPILEFFENPILTKNGEERVIYWHNGSIKDAKGNITGFLSSGEDITERNKTEEQLKNKNTNLKQLSNELSEKNRLLFDSQSKFKNLFEQSPVSLWEEDFSEVIQLLKKKKEKTGNLKSYLDENLDFINECISKIKILNVNKVTLELLGVKTLEELIAHIRKTNSKKAFEVLKQELLAFASNKKEFKGETEFYRTDGEVITALVKSVLIDKKGTAIASVIDITSLKKAEQELINAKDDAIESEKKFRELFEKSGDAILIIKNEIFIDCNQAAIDLLGYKSKENFLNSHPSALSPEFQPDGKTSITKAKELMETALKNGTHRFEWIHTKSNGKLFPVEVLLTAISNEPTNKIIHCVWRDITDRKETEYELLSAKEKAEESEYFLLKSQKIAHIGSYTLDITNGFWESTQVLDDIFGIDKEYNKDINGWLKIIHPDDQAMMDAYFKNEVLTQYHTFDKEYRIKKLNNQQVYWVHGMGELEFNNEGKPIKMNGTIQNITERKRNEQELLKAKEKAEESDRLKTEFINNMSHEIRTPMNGILGFSQFLEDPELTAEKRKHFVNIIQNSGNQLLHIIDDILEISRLGTKQVKVQESQVCLNDLLLELFSVFEIKAKAKNIPLFFKKELTDEQSTLLTDKTKLIKILSNLLDNALKFTNKGFIELGYNLKTSGKTTELEIYVKDTGIGIKPEKHELIFDRFSQAEKELSKNVGGLGLGLSIAKENTELIGGEIRVESEMMKGATFFITIPYKPIKAISKIKDSKEKIINEQKKYIILIAEDEEVNYLFIEILLLDEIKLPCTIIHAKDGIEAVEFCKNNPDINLVLMDIKMPKMNGHEASRLIKEFRPDIPIIAQTAYSTIEDKKIAISAGCNDFTSKPITKKTLKDLLDKHLIRGVTGSSNIY